MPVLFIGHGSPMNAIEDNEYTQSWKAIARQIPKPKGILCISAHWLREGSAVTAMQKPKTIHDFYGFPEEMYSINYPAPGSRALAKQIQKLVTEVYVELDQEWGLDHGSWSVLNKMYPSAKIPTVQLSLDYNLPLEKIVKIGRELSVLRKKGILIIGSGNLVHNLMLFRSGQKPFPWAVEFEGFVKKNLQEKNHDALIHYTKNASASLAHPSNDHYLPLLYALGAAENESPQFFNEGIVYGSISMMAVAYGMKKLAFK